MAKYFLCFVTLLVIFWFLGNIIYNEEFGEDFGTIMFIIVLPILILAWFANGGFK